MLAKNLKKKLEKLELINARWKLKRIQLEYKLGPLKEILDRIPKMIDPLIYGGVAYFGHKASEKLGAKFPVTLSGSLVAMLALKLATQSRNVVGGSAGIAVLSAIGVLNVMPVRYMLEQMGRSYSYNVGEAGTPFWERQTIGPVH